MFSEPHAAPGGSGTNGASGPSRVPGGGGKHGAYPGALAGDGHHSSHGAVGHHGHRTHAAQVVSMSTLEVPCPCLRPFGRRAARPDLAAVLYTTSTAVREALPVWLLAGANAGGIGASPPQVAAVFAAGFLVAGVGRAAAGCCCRGGGSDAGEGGALTAGRRLPRAVSARFAGVSALLVLYLLSRLLPSSSSSSSAVPLEVLLLAVMVVVAANHTSFELCAAAAAAAAVETMSPQPAHQRPMFVSRDTSSSSHGGGGGGGEWTRTASDASIGGSGRAGGLLPSRTSIVTRISILFMGDVVGSTAGPLLLALAFYTTRGSPVEVWLWLLLWLCGDLWLAIGAREAEPQHATLLGSSDEEEEDEVEEERRRSQRFAHFV